MPKTTSRGDTSGAPATRLTRDDVLRRFCRLAALVGSEHFKSRYAADCFCGQSGPEQAQALAYFSGVGMGDYRFDEEICQFIEAAVAEKLKKKRK